LTQGDPLIIEEAMKARTIDAVMEDSSFVRSTNNSSCPKSLVFSFGLVAFRWLNRVGSSPGSQFAVASLSARSIAAKQATDCPLGSRQGQGNSLVLSRESRYLLEVHIECRLILIFRRKITVSA
jgi:hypothetical protein